MNTSQLLIIINENLNFFKDKKISLQLTQNNGITETFEFENYNSFISEIKKLSEAGFSFIAVKNSCCERSILKAKNFNYWLKNGSWSVVRIYGTFVKLSNLKTA